MSIKQKTILIITSVSLAVIALMYLNSSIFIFKNLEAIENKKVLDSADNAISIFKNDLSCLNVSCDDWASWNDTYNFIKDKNEDYISDNLDKSSLSVLKVSSVIFLDNRGKLIFDRSYDGNYSNEISTPNELKTLISNGGFLSKHDNAKDILAGIVITSRGPELVSSSPVRNSQGDIDGSLIMTRVLDKEHLNWIDDVVDAKINISMKKLELSDAYIPFFKLDNYKLLSKLIDNTSAFGYADVKDITSKSELIISSEIPRVIFQQSYSNFKQVMLIFVFFMAIITFIAVVVLEKTLLGRINKLYNFIRNIKSIEDIDEKVSIKGKDEIAKLADVTNGMLGELKLSNLRVMENEERLRLVLEGTEDGFWDVDICAREIFISHHTAKIFGFGQEDMYIKIIKLKKILAEMNLQSITELYYGALEKNSDTIFVSEEKIFNKLTNEVKWIQIKGRIVMRYADGLPIRMAGTISDITARKESEDTIKYLSKYDVLTGLCNRASFSADIEKYNIEQYLPLSIILCDANGLKLVNDAFGHKAGDKLLVKIANILREACNGRGCVARLGGDEFALLLPQTDKRSAGIVVDKIISLCASSEADPIIPSLAVGCVTKTYIDEDIDKLIDKAEDRMYRNKLLQDKSARHSIIVSLEQSLAETDFETREHTMRLQELAVRLGKKIGLAKDKLDELSLLGSLHDIGKIAIPKDILRKPGKLTEEEWEIIKQHCEIGYRIAMSSVELVPIADGILAHHEKWNGTGYPKNLSGEEIPLLARIIAIVDAYDVITNDRPYKKAATHVEAISEVVRCKGTHFDPYLVDMFIKLFEESVAL